MNHHHHHHHHHGSWTVIITMYDTIRYYNTILFTSASSISERLLAPTHGLGQNQDFAKRPLCLDN